MADEFSLDQIPMLTGYVGIALKQVHDDIELREGVDGPRVVIIKMTIDPITLAMAPEITTLLPRSSDRVKLKQIEMFRENGTLKLGSAPGNQQALFPESSQ